MFEKWSGIRVLASSLSPLLIAACGATLLPAIAASPQAKSYVKTSSATRASNGGQQPKPLNRPINDKWALVVGVSRFADPTIPTLHYAAKDAQDFANFLIKEEHFAPDHVRVLLDEKATQRQILTELGDKFLPRVVRPDDLVVFYYSSHGSPAGKDVRNENFLVAYDTEKSNLWATGIDMQALTRIMRERVEADRVLILMDACHSGGGADRAKAAEPGANFSLKDMPLGSGQLMICSSKDDEQSWESKRYNNGIFTHALMQSLKANGPTTKLEDAFNHLQGSVESEVREDEARPQHPQIRNDWWKGNDLVIGLPPANPKPLPASVKTLLESQGPISATTPVVASASMLQSASGQTTTMPPAIVGATAPVSAPLPASNYGQPVLQSANTSAQGTSTAVPPGAGNFVGPDGYFRVNLPADINVERDYQGPFGRRRVYHQVLSNGCEFIVGYNNHTTEGFPYRNIEAVAKTWEDDAKSVQFTRFQLLRQFTVNNHPALEYASISPSRRVQCRTIMVATQDKSVVFNAIFPIGNRIPPEVSYFLNSIWVQ